MKGTITASESKRFVEWINSDNVVQWNGIYKTQCSQYRKEFTFNELIGYYKKEYLQNG
jgi:hypothetical protein